MLFLAVIAVDLHAVFGNVDGVACTSNDTPKKQFTVLSLINHYIVRLKIMRQPIIKDDISVMEGRHHAHPFVDRDTDEKHEHDTKKQHDPADLNQQTDNVPPQTIFGRAFTVCCRFRGLYFLMPGLLGGINLLRQCFRRYCRFRLLRRFQQPFVFSHDVDVLSFSEE